MKLSKLIYILFAVTLILSCKFQSKPSTDDDLEGVDLASSSKPINPLDTLGEGLPIFYNMYLSVELSTLFETAGAVFNKELLNTDENIADYITSSQKALNLGVYAVDLSYARAFDEFEVAGKYFNAMQRLSEELGIPTNYFVSTAQRFERNMTDRDSLIKIANEVYVETEEYLNENERYATASMIILGGWIEAVFIASNISAESNDPEVIERFVEQKYSLSNLLLMLEDHEGDEIISEFVSELGSLSDKFNKLETNFPEDMDVESDSGKELIKDVSGKIDELCDLLLPLRNKIID